MASTLTPSLVGARLGARRAPFNRADARPVAPSAPRPRGAAPGRSRAVSAPHVPSRRSRARSLAVVTRAVSEGDGKKPEYSNATKMRSEAQAPFRVARMFLFGAFTANAGLGFGIASLQAVTKALGAPAAPPLDQSLQNVAINLACALFFGYFYKRDEAGRDRQMARISREERLGALRCQLVGGKSVSLFDLRGFSRVVVAAGSAQYCAAAVEAAESHRDALVERGVLLVPVVLEPPSNGPSPVPEASEADKRFRAAPLREDKWRAWVEEQKREAKVGDATGVYVGLRMDGRVRSSGTGIPPWDRFAKELPPTDSWGGVMDGFDGRVGVDT